MRRVSPVFCRLKISQHKMLEPLHAVPDRSRGILGEVIVLMHHVPPEVRPNRHDHQRQRKNQTIRPGERPARSLASGVSNLCLLPRHAHIVEARFDDGSQSRIGGFETELHGLTGEGTDIHRLRRPCATDNGATGP